MIQLKTNEKFKWGQENIIPIIGLVQISKEGIIEVESLETAQQIEDLQIGFTIVEVNDETTTTTTQLQEANVTTTTTEMLQSKTEEDELGNKEENDSLVEENESNDLLKSLEFKTLAELKELAQPFPAIDWRSLNKAQLIEFLKSKLNASISSKR